MSQKIEFSSALSGLLGRTLRLSQKLTNFSPPGTLPTTLRTSIQLLHDLLQKLQASAPYKNDVTVRDLLIIITAAVMAVDAVGNQLRLLAPKKEKWWDKALWATHDGAVRTHIAQLDAVSAGLSACKAGHAAGAFAIARGLLDEDTLCELEAGRSLDTILGRQRTTSYLKPRSVSDTGARRSTGDVGRLSIGDVLPTNMADRMRGAHRRSASTLALPSTSDPSPEPDSLWAKLGNVKLCDTKLELLSIPLCESNLPHMPLAYNFKSTAEAPSEAAANLTEVTDKTLLTVPPPPPPPPSKKRWNLSLRVISQAIRPAKPPPPIVFPVADFSAHETSAFVITREAAGDDGARELYRGQLPIELALAINRYLLSGAVPSGLQHCCPLIPLHKRPDWTQALVGDGPIGEKAAKRLFWGLGRGRRGAAAYVLSALRCRRDGMGLWLDAIGLDAEAAERAVELVPVLLGRRDKPNEWTGCASSGLAIWAEETVRLHAIRHVFPDADDDEEEKALRVEVLWDDEGLGRTVVNL
ncbi:hypothetical protein EDC01DRAFT_633996 [Geopyxis carbonaria]|nr:hypothetical protein EDC01DRAFT_633996 [Geopyxis carbonaria]